MATIDVTEILRSSTSSLQPARKKTRFDDGQLNPNGHAANFSTNDAPKPEDILAALESDQSTNFEALDDAQVRKLTSQLEKKIVKNREMRVKNPDDPKKFMDSETEPDTAIQEIHTLATQPDHDDDEYEKKLTSEIVAKLKSCRKEREAVEDAIMKKFEVESLDLYMNLKKTAENEKKEKHILQAELSNAKKRILLLENALKVSEEENQKLKKQWSSETVDMIPVVASEEIGGSNQRDLRFEDLDGNVTEMVINEHSNADIVNESSHEIVSDFRIESGRGHGKRGKGLGGPKRQKSKKMKVQEENQKLKKQWSSETVDMIPVVASEEIGGSNQRDLRFEDLDGNVTEMVINENSNAEIVNESSHEIVSDFRIESGRGYGKRGKGLGGPKRQKSKKMKVHTNKGISKNDVRRLARKGGVSRISSRSYDEAYLALNNFCKKVIFKATKYANSGKRRTIVPTDIALALKAQGRTIDGRLII